MLTKTILKSIVVTLASIVMLLVMGFAVLSLAFPLTLSRVSASLGLYGVATHYAGMEYERSKDISDLAAATQYAIFAEDDRLIESYGDQLIEHPDFYAYCPTESMEKGDYQQYIFGRLACAKYNLGDKERAVSLVFSVNEDAFPANNAIIYLALSAIDADDKATCEDILTRLETFVVEGDQKEDLDNIKTILEEIVNE